MTFEAVNPDGLGPPRGFSHGLLAPAGGRVLFVAGQTPIDAAGRVVGEGFAGQFDAALGRVLAVVRQAGGAPADIGRMTVYVLDMHAYRSARGELGRVWRRHMAEHYPAMALVAVSALVDEGALLEIEATAVIP
ncbi:MAG: RidA family protein [Gemmatimonadetes bacterium]|nr:RidA family protein [Gemmatimonadota bacterium]